MISLKCVSQYISTKLSYRFGLTVTEVALAYIRQGKTYTRNDTYFLLGSACDYNQETKSWNSPDPEIPSENSILDPISSIAW